MLTSQQRHQLVNDAQSVFGSKSFKPWETATVVKEAMAKPSLMPKRPGISASHATKPEVKKMAMKAKTVEVTLTLPAPEEGYVYTGEWKAFTDVNGFATGGLMPWIKKLPFRAEPGRVYFYLREDFVVVDTTDTNTHWDRARWKAGNYFETGQAAQDIADSFKGCLDNLDRD